MARKKDPVFYDWEDARLAQHLTREQLAKETGVPLKWLNDYMNRGKVAIQVYYVKKIEHRLNFSTMPHRYKTAKETFED